MPHPGCAVHACVSLQHTQRKKVFANAACSFVMVRPFRTQLDSARLFRADSDEPNESLPRSGHVRFGFKRVCLLADLLRIFISSTHAPLQHATCDDGCKLKVLFMAVDGVAPRAKMNQQRSRRFRSAQEMRESIEAKTKLREELLAQGCQLPDEPE